MGCSDCSASVDPARTVSTPLGLLTLASEFLAHVAHERGAWPEMLRRWGVAQGLSDEVIDELRQVLVRERVRRAIAWHRGRR